MQKQILLLFVLTLIFSIASVAQTNTKPFVVVLDAGHGGKDPGRPTNFGYKEKDIALDIALKVGENLKRHGDIQVIYTRSTDVFIELRQRAKIANKADADLFVSIHCNAHNSQAYGTETYVLGIHRNDSNFRVAQQENEVIFLEDDFESNYEGFDPNSPESMIGLTLMQEDYLDQSILLARYVQDNFTYKLKRKNRGVKQAGFWVLHNTYMPSILIETGFITNKTEGDYLNSASGKINMSKSISDAILDYKSKLNSDTPAEIETASNQVDYVDSEVVLPVDAPVVEPSLSKPLIVFKVQIAAGSKKLAPKSYNFNGLDQISRQKSNTIYRYFYGNTTSYSAAVKLLDIAISKGFSDALVVAYKDGEKTSIKQALKSSVN